MILVLKSGLLCVFTCTLSLFSPPSSLGPPCFFVLSLSQVMETKNMLYLVTEYAKNGEIFGEWSLQVQDQSDLSTLRHFPTVFTQVLPISAAHRILHCCISRVFFWQTRKYQSLVELAFLEQLYPAKVSSQRSHDWWKSENMPWCSPCHVLLVIAVLNVLTAFHCRVKLFHRRLVKAI